MRTNGVSTKNERRLTPSHISFISAVLGAISIAMIGFTSFTAFNPPDWLRIISMAPFPFLLILSVLFGITSLNKRQDRVWAILGLVIAGLSVVAFGIMIGLGS